MNNRRWAQCDRWMRGLHLYTSLALVPWMTVYAVSAFCLNHNSWFESLKLVPQWVVERQVDFTPDSAFPADPDGQAKAILHHLNLDGPYRIQGTPDRNQLTLYRPCATSYYRVTFQRQHSRVVVEKQRPVSFYSMANALHFQHGYDLPSAAHRVWAATVDVVTFSTVLWIVSGIYLWARRPTKRFFGEAFAWPEDACCSRC